MSKFQGASRQQHFQSLIDIVVHMEKYNGLFQVKWNKNGHEVKFDDRVEAVTEGTVYKLVISDARLDDAEQYIITLPDGKKSKAMLKVDGKFTFMLL